MGAAEGYLNNGAVRCQFLPFAPDVFLPLSSGVTNPMDRLADSGGVISSRKASNTCLSCARVLRLKVPWLRAWAVPKGGGHQRTVLGKHPGQVATATVRRT